MIKWIKVEDQLPYAPYENDNFSETVLIFDGEYIGVGYYESEYNIADDINAYEGQQELFSSAAWHSEGGYLKTDISGFPIVTHWANLPEKPKADQSCRFCMNPDSIISKETCCSGCSILKDAQGLQ